MTAPRREVRLLVIVLAAALVLLALSFALPPGDDYECDPTGGGRPALVPCDVP